MRNLSLSKVYRLLEPGPVVLLTTASKGRSNVMAMSWHMMVEFTPPLVDPSLPDHFGNRYSYLRLLQHSDHLLYAESLLLHQPPSAFSGSVMAKD
jgi:flavin reductase (DIM6/NTAB) family NADH-FMN oxidoreductase RutF